MSNKKSIIKQCVGITSATVLMTMAVSVGTGHSASQKSGQTTINQQLSNRDEVRQITRTIKLMIHTRGCNQLNRQSLLKRLLIAGNRNHLVFGHHSLYQTMMTLNRIPCKCVHNRCQ